MKREYDSYRGPDVDVFYRVPLIMLDSTLYPDLSTEAVLLYGLLLDRMCLSLSNVDRFLDEDQRVYIIYPVDDICRALTLKRKKVMSLMNILEESGLITRKKAPGMDNTNRIYVRNYAAALAADCDEAYPYFYGNDQADVHSFIRVPFSLLQDPYIMQVGLEAVFLYCLMLDRLQLSVMNKDRFCDENGSLYIYYSIESIMGKMRVGKNKAIKMMAALDDEKGIGLIHKEREDGWSNTNRIYVKKYEPSAAEDSSVNNTAEEPDAEAPMRKEDPDWEEKEPESLEIKKVPNVNLRKSQNQTFESPKIKPSKVPISNLRKSQNQTFESPENKPSKVPISNPNHINIIHTDINQLTKTDLQKESYQLQSHQETDVDCDADFSFKIPFSDRFAEAIELENILPDLSMTTTPEERKAALQDRTIIKSVYEETVRAASIPGKKYQIDGITYSAEDLQDMLCDLSAEIFMEAVERLKKTKKEIVHWDSYILTVMLQVKRTMALCTMNKLSVFEGKMT